MSKFIVITKLPKEGRGGNMATALGSLFQAQDMLGDVVKPVDPRLSIQLVMPVFDLGEILVVGGDGRELAGKGRKPSKWFVEYEEFDDIDMAIARAMEVSRWTTIGEEE